MPANVDATATSFKGALRLNDWRTIRISGEDTRDFLHRLSTLNFRAPLGTIRLGAFLTGKAQIISVGFFEETEAGVLYSLPAPHADAALAHLDKMHFAEDLKLEPIENSEIWVADAALAETSSSIVEAAWKESTLGEVTWMRASSSKAPFAANPSIKDSARNDFHRYCVARNSPLLDLPLLSDTLILEANLEQAIDRDKGCYPGQEVVERIFTYGQVNRRLFPVELERTPETLPCALQCDGSDAGILVSCTSGTNGKPLGLALIHKKFWEKGELKGDPDLVVTVL